MYYNCPGVPVETEGKIKQNILPCMGSSIQATTSMYTTAWAIKFLYDYYMSLVFGE